MFGLSKTDKSIGQIKVDIHSHLIPGIDDGAKSMDDSLSLLRQFSDLGYEKVITTPHIHPNYPNTPDLIRDKLSQVKEELVRLRLQIEIEGAAEYFVDEHFFETVKSNKEILSFGDNYVLVESSFVNKPMIFETCMFELQSKGYKPILAHPERYRFLEGDLNWLMQLKEIGVLMQVTIGSFVGYYGSTPQMIAKKLYKHKMIDFLGSDLHRENQFTHLSRGLKQKEVEKLCKSSQLRNDDLN